MTKINNFTSASGNNPSVNGMPALPDTTAISGGRGSIVDGDFTSRFDYTVVSATDYCGPFVYENGVLDRINLDNGYLSYRSRTGSRLDVPEYHFYLRDHLGNNRMDINAANQRFNQAMHYYPFGLPFYTDSRVTSDSRSGLQRWLFGNKELDRTSGLDLYDFEARAYDPTIIRFRRPDDLAFKYQSTSPYTYCLNNPIMFSDLDGNSPTVATGLLGGGIGAIIGGVIEVGTQLYRQGNVNNWDAVMGSATQGAITGAAAGLTCGTSLAVTVGVSSVSNAVGGVVNREIQNDETTTTDVIADVVIGGVAGSTGSALGLFTKKGLDASSAATKGKIGEVTTQIKYALKGYHSNGKAVIQTGKRTLTGREQVARYDFKMKKIFTNDFIIVESKFNTAGFTPNQRAAYPNVTIPLVLDRTTSLQFQNAIQSMSIFGNEQIFNRINNY